MITAIPSVQLLFVAGHAQAGKDTFMEVLFQSMGTSVVKVGMSDAIINIASYLYPTVGSAAWSDQEMRTKPRPELNGRTTREVLRQIGDKLREQDPYVWINCMVRSLVTITERNPDARVLVVPGIRLIKEALVGRAIGAHVVGIRSSRIPVDDPNTPTEREVGFILNNLCHHVIDNNGTKEELKTSALKALAYCPHLDHIESLQYFSPNSHPDLLTAVSRHESEVANMQILDSDYSPLI